MFSYSTLSKVAHQILLKYRVTFVIEILGILRRKCSLRYHVNDAFPFKRISLDLELQENLILYFNLIRYSDGGLPKKNLIRYFSAIEICQNYQFWTFKILLNMLATLSVKKSALSMLVGINFCRQNVSKI